MQTAFSLVSSFFPAKNILYGGSNLVASAAVTATKFAGEAATSGLHLIHPQLGSMAEQVRERISQVSNQLNLAATAAITNDAAAKEFSAAELIAPVLLTFGSGWMAAKSAHRVAKNAKMLLTCQRIETLEESSQVQKGAVIKERVFVPHSTRDLLLSSIAHTFLAPIWFYVGNLTQEAIQERLTEVGVTIAPLPALVLTGAAVYALTTFGGSTEETEEEESIEEDLTEETDSSSEEPISSEVEANARGLSIVEAKARGFLNAATHIIGDDS